MSLFALIVGLPLTQPGPSAPASTAQAPQPAAAAEFRNAAGETIGTAALFEGPGGLLLRIEAEGLTPGRHGVHLHAKGACAAPDFASAGPHVGSGDHTHGLLSHDGHEAGDLPNLTADAAGAVAADLWSTSVSLRGGDGRPALLDADGSAVVIHAGADDQATQPTGGSGARVACAVIRPG